MRLRVCCAAALIASNPVQPLAVPVARTKKIPASGRIARGGADDTPPSGISKRDMLGFAGESGARPRPRLCVIVLCSRTCDRTQW